MKRLFAVALLLFCALLAAQEDFDLWRQSAEEQWRGYERQVDEEFLSYKRHIEHIWAEFVDSTPKVWVDYGPDKAERSIVDFENGAIELAVLLPEETINPDGKAISKLSDQLLRILNAADATGEPILAGQLAGDSGDIIDESNVSQEAPTLVQEPQIERIVTDEGPKLRYTVTLDMVEDHLQQRIDRYLPDILSFCRRFEVPAPLVMGVIHCESCFNPRAVNHESGAVGLMQIMPQYAGVTMNRILHSDPSEPTQKQLFNPRFNLEMGVGYLHYLEVHYFTDIEVSLSLCYAMIAAYNGGAGNVFRTFTGQSRRSDAFVKIVNELDAEEMFIRLSGNHPYGETRRYLIRVTSLAEDYGGLE